MFVLYWAKISGEHLQDHWSSGVDDPTISTNKNEPCREKVCFWDFWPGPTQIGLYYLMI